MADIQKRWVKEYKPGFADSIGDTANGPLKPRIVGGVRMIRMQNNKLGAIISRLEHHEKSLFRKVVDAKSRQDIHAAKTLASEMVELRKVKRVMSMARLSLEKMEIRLSMYNDLGDTVSTIAPITQLMRSLGSSLGRFVPNADAEINQMADMLNGFMGNTLEGDAFGSSAVAGEEIDSIMEQAAAVASESVGSKLPSMPAEADAVQSKSFY